MSSNMLYASELDTSRNDLFEEHHLGMRERADWKQGYNSTVGTLIYFNSSARRVVCADDLVKQAAHYVSLLGNRSSLKSAQGSSPMNDDR